MKHHPAKWLLPLVLSLVMCAAVLPLGASAAEEGPTKAEIRQKWQTVTYAEDLFITEPSITAPYAAGELSDSFLESGITYFNFVRFVAGLPEVQLDDTLNTDAQHGAVTLAALDQLTHYPSKPAGMDEEFYQRAYGATTTSNISGRWGYNPLICIQHSVLGCMNDNNSSNNLSTVGHRRWILNPDLGKIGFGYAQANSGWSYIVTPVFDRSGPGCDYNFIAWPVAGNHPISFFDTENPWSVSLNPAIYRTPSVNTVQITITRQSDNRTWTFDSTTGQSVSNHSPYMLVNTQGYGIRNCIIFHPGSDNVDAYEGVFTVDISGIYYTNGSAATLHYEVDFFDHEAPCTTHEYEAAVTAATCTEDGSATYTCVNCCYSYTEILPATGHSFSGGQCSGCGTYGGTDGCLDWLLEDGTLTISGEGAMSNYTYKSEMPWYVCADRVNAVVIEEGVTTVGSYAFYGMDIESIDIPSSVNVIGSFAFKNCEKLDGVVLPDGLAKLGESAFYGCTSLTAIDIPASLWTVQPYTFKNCTALERVAFHEGNLLKISDGSFYGTALTEVTFPDCLTILDVYSFKNCTALERIHLGTGLTEIREAVFYATSISDITIPEGITRIGPYVFKNCVNLGAVSLPESLRSVGEASFYACTALESLTLPDAVTIIGSYAFRRCTDLKTVIFSDNLATIGESSFYGCSGLTELVIPDSVTTIHAYAFKGCTDVTSLTLGSRTATLGDSAFHTCTGLKTVTFPESITSLGEYCFSGSRGLQELAFTGDAPSIGTGAFNKLTLTACYPSGNATWTSAVMQNYGGQIIWKAA